MHGKVTLIRVPSHITVVHWKFVVMRTDHRPIKYVFLAAAPLMIATPSSVNVCSPKHHCPVGYR